MSSPTPKPFARLQWESHFAERLPGDPNPNNYIRVVNEAIYSEVQPTPVKNPQLIGWSDSLAAELGIAKAEDQESLELLSGNRVLPSMRPYAARYGGHQFGNWAGQLGDGRAITLGEVRFPDRGCIEFQLKGAGMTPYSRRADGRAVLRSSLREFVCSEAMHFLGVPTTRALSLVSTGDEVIRDMFYDGNPKAEPGAIVCRVSPSFLRFGNFEILASNEEFGLLRDLAMLLIEDHFPELSPTDPDVFGKYLDEISRRTARMITEWMRVGFVHGVMNTDNMSAIGLTIDYGPYGWLEPYDPGWTPNTTDAEGRRYRFGNQPGIAQWNLMRLCEAFYPLIKDEARLHESLKIYQTSFESTYSQMLSEKLGLSAMPLAGTEEDLTLGRDLFELLQLTETDYTLFFRALSDWPVQGGDFLARIHQAFYSPDPISQELKNVWTNWSDRYSARLKLDGKSGAQRSAEMKKVNPKYVFRNYLAQDAINAATVGDLSKLERLMRVLKNPYDEQPLEEDLAQKRPEWARQAPGCSALSCSS